MKNKAVPSFSRSRYKLNVDPS